MKRYKVTLEAEERQHLHDLIAAGQAAARKLAANKYRVLLTKVPPAPEMDGPQLRSALQREHIPVFAAEIARLKSFERAAAAGVPVYAVKHDAQSKRAWQGYEDAGKEIANG
jgi:chromosome partitioning protein